MKVRCPKCSGGVPPDKVNVATDIVFCPACNEAFRLSDCVGASNTDGSVLDSPPRGAWVTEDVQEATVGASTRSPVAFFLVPFMCVWSGGALGGIYGSQIASGEFDLMMSLFGIPFLLGSIIFWTLAIMAVCGKVVVRVSHEQGSVFVGVGSIGWTRLFNWTDMQTIREDRANVYHYGGYGAGIVLEGTSRIKFGTNLSEKRRYFMLHALRQLRGKIR